MSFENRLQRAIDKLVLETELDYSQDWEKHRQQREEMRRQAALDQQQAGQADAKAKLNQEISTTGGFRKWATQDPAKRSGWQPPLETKIIWDVETENGIILPSVKARGKNIHLFIPWIWIEYRPGTVNTDPTIEQLNVFAQFDEDQWPAKDDFNWSSSQVEQGTKNPKILRALCDSDANHYHMLRGADKTLVDTIAERAADGFLDDYFDTVSQDEYD